MCIARIKSPAYPFKHWLSTVLIGPLVFYLFEAIKGDLNYSADLLVYPLLFACIGFFYSFPTFIGFYFLFRYLARRRMSAVLIKLLLNCFAIAGMLVTSNLIGGTMMPELYFPYTTAIILSSLPFKVDKPILNQVETDPG